MKKEILLVILLGIMIVVLLGIFIFVPGKKTVSSPNAGQDLQIISPVANQEVSSPLSITGAVNGNGWAGFEGQVGIVKMTDYKGNVIGQAVLQATSDWTKLPTSFSAILSFAPNNPGPVTLLFKNENPSGDPAKDKTFELQLKAKQ